MKYFIKTKFTAGVVLFVTLSFILGIYIGFNQRPEIEKVLTLTNKENPAVPTTDFEPFWKAWNAINEKSPDKTITDQDKIYGAISGLMGSLKDPYSVFFNPEDAKVFQDEIQGSFSGIGAEIDIKDGILTIIAPLKDSPSFKAGLKAGDKIIKINKTISAELSINEALNLIRGEKGTPVVLTVLHEGEKETKEIKIIRDTVTVPNIETELRPDGIFVIRLFSFSANSGNLFQDALREFSKANTDKMILDLRGNPGGFLDMAINISSWFLPAGKTIVTEDYGNNKEPTIYRSKGYDIFNDNLKFVILIDGGSASASEIVAGAMQDYKKGLLVGSQSFGKGSVQEIVHVTTDTILKITVAKWLTPNGNLINKKGLTPDYVVKYTKKDADAKKDPQLDKAVELLNKWPK